MSHNSAEEMSVDLKNDIWLAFNWFKNENDQIKKIKLRTWLFSFVMYKTNAKEINEFIEEQTSPDQENFTYEEVCKLVNLKWKSAKEKESDEIFSYICAGKNESSISEKDISKAFDKKIDASPEEIKEMMKYMIGDDAWRNTKGQLIVTRDQFKQFYTDTK